MVKRKSEPLESKLGTENLDVSSNEADANATAESAEVTYASSHFECNEVGTTDAPVVEDGQRPQHNEAETGQKRNKVDKDGFTTPLSPVPRSNQRDYIVSGAAVRAKTENTRLFKDDDNNLENGKSKANMLSVADIIKECEEQTKLSSISSTPILSESESFELFCPTRLDQILSDALALEASLKQQKEVLRQRLSVLSSTLKII
ncbi:unnamed protein product [Owenia fusiformis]|uniref:Uncharacterized protein n=1 Tax=Owenia fusiformis TaxID=6347 RepID=A0A8J1XPY4_OWEFU|nr:unnamed protein product [Owenia fusiformis]